MTLEDIISIDCPGCGTKAGIPCCRWEGEVVPGVCTVRTEKVQNQKELEKNLVLVWDTAKDYAERTGGDFWTLRITQQRKELENYAEDHQYDLHLGY